MSDSSFDPKSANATAARQAAKLPSGFPYVEYLYSHELELAIRVALVTGRPLLLRGDPGCGKSTVARDAALVLGRDYYEEVVSSRTRAADLMWRFDAVRRLGDAQAEKGRLPDQPHRYLEPGILWWAFHPTLARTRGLSGEQAEEQKLEPLKDPAWGVATAGGASEAGSPRRRGAVVLLDEIDKAEPDVPNDLLLPLGENVIRVPYPTLEVARSRDVLVVITTNGERDLPPAFLRRCLVFTLERPKPERLSAIAALHFPKSPGTLFEEVRLRLDQFVKDAGPLGRHPGTAEYLDAIRACVELQVRQGHVDWETIMQATLWKGAEPPPKVTPSEGATP